MYHAPTHVPTHAPTHARPSLPINPNPNFIRTQPKSIGTTLYCCYTRKVGVGVHIMNYTQFKNQVLIHHPKKTKEDFFFSC